MFSALEVLEKKELDFQISSIISAVASGLHAASYRNEAAQAVTIHSAKQDGRYRTEQHRSLMEELKTGLFQRHTVWPNSSYMGQVKASLITSIKIRAGVSGAWMPSPDYYQVCADFGGKEHTFVFVEETEVEE